MKALILSLLLCFGAQATITQVQQVTDSTSTTVTLNQATGSGHILIAMFALQGAGSSVTAVSGGGTWVHAPNCYATSGAQIVDCWYVLSSTPGATAVTTALTGGRAAFFYEFSVGAGCVANYDGSSSLNDSASLSNQPGVGLTLTGTNDVIVQGIYGGTVSAISSGYADATATNRAAASLLNTISGIAPTWATSGAPSTAAVNAIAINESCAPPATITQVQQVTDISSTTVTLNQATGSGHILIAMFAMQGAGSSVTAVSDSTGETWVHAPNCYATSGAQIVDCWYVLSSTPGATAITTTLTGGRAAFFYEFSAGAGCVASYDSSGSLNDGASLANQPGVGLTLTGTNDVIVQGIYGGTVSSINGGYLEVGSTNRAAASLLNTISGTAPTWTTSGAPSTAAVNGIAISVACSVAVSVLPAQTTVFGLQTQQFTATVMGVLNAPVTWSIGPPGVGSISASGLYTAPAPSGSVQTVTVTATSQTNGTAGSAMVAIPAGATLLDTYSLSELFGVAWPDQPIEFKYTGPLPLPSPARMIGPLGAEVPFQWVSSCSDATATNGCVAVRSNLPANASYNWTLVSDVPATATPVNPVRVNTVGNNLEITNGRTGVRIITQAANPAPFNRAPIQGIWLPGGTWTGAGASANLLYAQSAGNVGNVGDALNVAMSPATIAPTSYTVTVEAGPLKTVVKVNYTFTRPQYIYPPTTIINAAGVGPASGHYTLTATLYANSKSVLIDEDTDMSFSYYLPLYAQLQPDMARWRGADSIDGASIGDPICGYAPPLTVTAATAGTPMVITTSIAGNLVNGNSVQITGVLNLTPSVTYFAKTTGYPANQFALYQDTALTIPVAGAGVYGGGGIAKASYLGQFLVPTPDAFQDLSYNLDRPANYTCTTTSYRKMLADYPPGAHAAGWYVEMYKSTAGAAAPVVGFYTGRASKQVSSSTGPSLPGIYTSNNHFISHAKDAGIQVDTLMRSPSGTTVCQVALPCSQNGAPDAVVHRNWGIFVSTQADLLNPTLHQPIADEQNMLTGINLSRLYTYQLVYPDPPGGWQWLYLTNAGAAQLESWVQNGTAVCGTPSCYARLLNGSEGSVSGQALVSMWQGNSTAAVQTALNSANNLAAQLVQTLVAGDNHFDNTLGYYQLGLRTSPETAVLNAILMNANTTPAQKTLAKAELALFGSIFWDDDWFPIDNTSGESVGLANQIQQYLEYRAQSVFSNASQPFLSQMLATAVSSSTNDFSAYFGATGAAAGSTHYQSAFFEPLILNYMNPATQGQLSMADPKWANYANWELSIQTPPEPRFGNPRKGYSNGDGNTEADVRTGMLGTALYPVNAPLAGNLMWAWQQSNIPSHLTEDNQFVTTIAVIDPSIPPVVPGTGGTPPLASTNIPGYHSVERFNFNTPNETALWFIDGGFYQLGGHRHYDDGQVSIYAHSAPLAIDWNANLYSPETPGRFSHDSIVYDSELLPGLWSADKPSLSAVSTLMQNPTNTEFAAFKNSTTSTGTFVSGDGTTWTRTVRTMNFDPSYPIIYVNDTFSGASAATGKTLTWNLMATGAVSTPAGSITPTTRFSASCQPMAGALPSNGTVSSLASGLSHFNFTGVTWPAHATQGINWDLFTLSNDSTGHFLIGNWGHGCHPVTEESEFQQANGVPFAETQHILRVHDTGPFTTVMLPYRKTEVPTRTVSQQACGVQIAQGNETTCFNNSASTYSNLGTHILTVFDTSSQAGFGVSVSGGPQEVVIQSGQIVWTISGIESGARSVTLPAGWSPAPPVQQNGNTFTVQFPGGAQATPVSVVFTQ